MKTRNTKRHAVASLLMAMALSPWAAAQGAGSMGKLADLVAPQSAGHAKDFGIKNVTGQLRLYGKTGLAIEAKDGPKLTAVGGAALDVAFLGALREALAIEAELEVGLGKPSGRARSNAVASRQELKDRADSGLKKSVRVCGFTLRLDNAGSDANEKMGPKDLVPGGISTMFMVGPVPCIIVANAGVGVDLGMAPFVETADVTGGTSVRVGMEGKVGAYLNGWVIGGVGGGCRLASAVAGVKADVRLMDASTGLRVGCGTLDGLMTKVTYALKPAALQLLAIAYCEVRVWRARIGKKFEYLLYQWSAPAIEGTIPVVGA